MVSALLVTLALVAPARVQDSGVIVGGWVVHAHSGARLPGARVSMHCGSKFPTTTQWTDMDGAFVFRGLPAGRCTLHAALGTHMPRMSLTLRGGERRLLDVPLDPASKSGDYWFLQKMSQHDAHITRVPLKVPSGMEVLFGGWVVHERSREGLPGALVVLRCGETLREESTDLDGAFAFRDVKPGECTLQVVSAGVNQTSALVFGAGERRLLEVAVDPERKMTIDPAFREELLRSADSVKIRLTPGKPR